MNISIKPELQKFIEEQLKAGHYKTPDDVINTALIHLQAHVELPPDEIKELRAEIDLGLEDFERGNFVEWDPEAIWSEVERMHAERARSNDKKAG
jgi:antitoxin ParD1/3/4